MLPSLNLFMENDRVEHIMRKTDGVFWYNLFSKKSFSWKPETSKSFCSNIFKRKKKNKLKNLILFKHKNG